MEIYTITTIQERKLPKPMDTRCVGYCTTFQEAEDEVLNNSMDIHEDSYKYAVIEEVAPGIYNFLRKEVWYEWDDSVNSYKKLEQKPEQFKHIVCWGIG